MFPKKNKEVESQTTSEVTEVNFVQLHPEAKLPTQGTEDSCAWDLTAVSETVNIEERYIEYDTGWGIELPQNSAGILLSRSSISKKDLILANGSGLIDVDFRGSIKMRFKSLLPIAARKYRVGDKIGQLLITPYIKYKPKIVQQLSETKRGSGSFGSTDSDKGEK